MFLSTIVAAILFTCFGLNYAVFKKRIEKKSEVMCVVAIFGITISSVTQENTEITLSL